MLIKALKTGLWHYQVGICCCKRKKGSQTNFKRKQVNGRVLEVKRQTQEYLQEQEVLESFAKENDHILT